MDMIETIKLMLDALENHTAIKHPQQIHYRDRAIEAGRQAIARAEGTLEAEKQEPLAWMTAHRFDQLLNGFNVMTTLTKQKAFTDDVAIYTHPYTRQPKQKPLTDDKVRNVYREVFNNPTAPRIYGLAERFARAIEDAHGIK
jgi:hypothetical protein